MSANSNVWSLYTREYSRFFPDCIDENYDGCINQECGHVGEWTLVPLDVINMNEYEDENYDDIPLISTDYGCISGLIKVGMYFIIFVTLMFMTHGIYIHILCVGNIFAVMAQSENIEGVSYYLLCCAIQREKLTKTKISDGIMFPIG